MTVHLYKYSLSKLNSYSILRNHHDYSYKLAYWLKILENNKSTWNYLKVPPNTSLKEFIYNRNLIQSNYYETVQIYSPDNLLTLNLLDPEYKHKLKNFHKVRVEFTYNFQGSSGDVNDTLYLFTLTNKSKLIYIPCNKLNRYNITSTKDYFDTSQLTLKKTGNKLIIDLN